MGSALTALEGIHGINQGHESLTCQHIESCRQTTSAGIEFVQASSPSKGSAATQIAPRYLPPSCPSSSICHEPRPFASHFRAKPLISCSRDHGQWRTPERVCIRVLLPAKLITRSKIVMKYAQRKGEHDFEEVVEPKAVVERILHALSTLFCKFAYFSCFRPFQVITLQLPGAVEPSFGF